MMALAMLVQLPADARKARKSSRRAPATQVIYTGDLAAKVIGYQGTTPLNVTIENGRIKSIEALPNHESPAYFERAKNHVFKQYIGKTVKEARNIEGDIATGATYSSEALIKNIQAAVKSVK